MQFQSIRNEVGYVGKNFANIVKVSKTFPALLITGPRQVGKTTLLEMLSSKKRKYISLDNFADRELAQKDTQMFLKNILRR